ncbi:MAG TPA: TadE family protein [Marmoricola sp.]|jgi:Flp pilus assembly protein TadG|nr:TadE family protein [Marmoricola sp.]
MRRRRDSCGAVTAETAMAVPVLVLLAMALAWVVALGVSQARITDAARETARSLARGDSESAAIALGRRVAPDGARFEVRRSGGTVTVTVTTVVGGPGGALKLVPGHTLQAQTAAALEPGAGP